MFIKEFGDELFNALISTSSLSWMESFTLSLRNMEMCIFGFGFEACFS